MFRKQFRWPMAKWMVAVTINRNEILRKIPGFSLGIFFVHLFT